MSRETVDNAIGGYEFDTSGYMKLEQRAKLVSTTVIDELQRKADMADELAGVMEKVSAMIPQDLNDERFGRVTNPAYYTLKDALAKYRGRSHATTETGERVDVAINEGVR